MLKLCLEARSGRSRFRGALLFALPLVILAVCSGCTLTRRKVEWRDAECRFDAAIQSPQPLARRPVEPCRHLAAGADWAQQAAALEAADDSACVDLYYAAACAGWRQLAAQADQLATEDLIAHAESYHAALAKLLITGQRFGRLDPACALQVIVDGQPVRVPVSHWGFGWSADDFNFLEPVGEYQLQRGAQAHRKRGLGLPLVVQRLRDYDEQFYRRIHPFAATAILVVDEDCGLGELRLYNPARCTHLEAVNTRIRMAGDLTAPLAWWAAREPNDPLNQFLRPASGGEEAQLVMLEPYQAGKIPVVFVHGLLSDPTTWIRFANELNRHEWYRRHCQTWAFRYPTGAPFLVSAAALRRELNAAIVSSPASASDPAAAEMVLIGHSLGGLVAKLQVADSGNALWNVTANRPIDGIQASPRERESLRETFFFSPQPFVRHVVFIGTPHGGSSLAQRGIGRVASLLVRPDEIADTRHRDLIANNPGVFAPWLERRVPTSIDLLKPGHPLLMTVAQLAIPPDVELHSVIGVVPGHPLNGPGDGVVSLASASHAGVASRLLVNEPHEQLHHAASTMVEIERILQDHLTALGMIDDSQPLLRLDRLRLTAAAGGRE